jgi:branched-chain amino acid transport system substrate-binding protein
MNKKAIWGVVVIVLIFIVWGVSGISSKKGVNGDASVIKIGVIAPLTGPGAVFGSALAKGIELAKRDLAGTKYTYEVFVEDDGTNPAVSASAAQKLINIEKVQAIITTTSGTGNAVKPIATGAKVVHFCVCADSSIGDGVYNFTNILVPEDEGAGYVKEAVRRGVKTMAIWSQIHPGINAIMDALKPQAIAAGIKIVYEDRYESNMRDFKTSIAKGKKVNPDTFFILAFPPSLDIIGQDFKNQGIKNISAVSAFAISSKPEIFEGYWFTDPDLVDLKFKARFEKEFPSVRFNVRTAPYGYDTFNMVVNGFEKGNVSKIIADMTKYEGKVGVVTKTLGSGVFHSPTAIWTIKNGKAELLK